MPRRHAAHIRRRDLEIKKDAESAVVALGFADWALRIAPAPLIRHDTRPM
jgi:hypothetical protein